MRAALLEAPGRVRVVDDVVLAEPRAGQVCVRVSHCGICHSDLSVVDGAFPTPLPVVLGHEASGVVDSVGPGVESLAPGDPVVLTACPPCGTCYWCVRGEASLCVQSRAIATSCFEDGSTGLSRKGDRVFRGLGLAAFAEAVLVHETAAVRIPEDVPRDVACVVGCAVQTGVGAVLNTARVEEGATVLVMGLGGIGLSIVQGARLAGASRVIASDPLGARREAARRLGATELVDPSAGDVAEAVVELTGVGVDYAFEAAGRSALIRTGLAATRAGGTTVCVGAPPLDEALTLEAPAALVWGAKKLVGCVLGSCHALRDIPRLIGLWRAGRLDLEALITARRPLEEIAEGLDDLRAGRGIRTVLEI